MLYTVGKTWNRSFCRTKRFPGLVMASMMRDRNSDVNNCRQDLPLFAHCQHRRCVQATKQRNTRPAPTGIARRRPRNRPDITFAFIM